MSLAAHRTDPDAVPSSSPAVLDYVARVERLGRQGPAPLRQLHYGPDRAQRIDVYAPPGARDLPVLLFLHGGAWIDGHLGWLRFMAEPAMRRGALFVAATYRLAPRHRWPAQAQDAVAALAFVRAHAAGWGGDPARIVIGGHSAGGQLAAVVALTAGAGAVGGCMPVSAPFDLRHGDVPDGDDRARVYRHLLERAEDDAAASPLLLADRTTVPFHVVWGERDLPHVARSGAAMVERLGARATHDVLADATHFDTHLGLSDPASPWYDRLRAFWAGGR